LYLEDAFQVCMSNNETGDVQPHLVNECAAQMNVMTQIVHSQLQSVEAELGLIAGQFGRTLMLATASEPDDGNANHGRIQGFGRASLTRCVRNAGTTKACSRVGTFSRESLVATSSAFLVWPALL